MNYSLTIKNETTFIISPIFDSGVIINDGNEPIIIDGGKIIVEFNNEDEYVKFIEQIKNNKSYEFIIIKGKYDGSFNDFIVQLSSNVTKCERVKPTIKENENQLSYSFTIDKSECSTLKWWMILLIVLGVVIVLSVIAVIIIVTVKPTRRKVLPFRDRRTRAS